MKVTTTALPGVLLLTATYFPDERGGFAELFQTSRYADVGIVLPFVQDNWSYSCQNVLRGLHIQPRFAQGKLVTVCQGHVWDVVADINPASPSYGQHIAVDLYGFDNTQEENAVQQLWVPPGYAHGFCVLSAQASVIYKCTQTYHPEDDCGVVWSDPQLNIPWPVACPKVSERDAALPTLDVWEKQSKGGFRHG